MWTRNRYAINTKAQDYCIGKIIVLINFELTIKENVNETLSVTGVSNKLKIRKGNLRSQSKSGKTISQEKSWHGLSEPWTAHIA